MPYAEALAAASAPINLCLPGGVQTLRALGEKMGQDPSPYIDEMEAKAKPAMIAVIREAECIGCTKCIQACPVDAILGAAKQMHTVVSTECTGCELCVAPCPVDCIDLIEISPPNMQDTDNTKANHARKRFQARELRLASEKKIKLQNQLQASKHQKQRYIQAALARVKAKKTILSS
jgi:electron transport complex protein RnfB